MSGFNDQKFAARFRDLIRSLVAEEIEKARPRPRYGTVTAVNTGDKTVSVDYGDGSTPVPIRYGTVVPAVSDIVRIAGVHNDRYIDDVVNPA